MNWVRSHGFTFPVFFGCRAGGGRDSYGSSVDGVDGVSSIRAKQGVFWIFSESWIWA